MPDKLANRYRPKTWSDVIGQEHITSILSGMLQRGATIPTGMVFVGTAGSGKTTNARIMAKAINCTGEFKPCGTCPNCELFSKLKSDGTPSHPDYMEVDGTTYGGKEDAETLLDLASRSPSIQGCKRVILIDEAHRMSNQAWDVFLKPLEEGLRHTIFMFATTELDKVRKAVLSRCPAFVTKPLSQRHLYGYLKYILDSEGIEYEEKSLTLLSYNFVGQTRKAVTEMGTHILAHGSFKGYIEKSVYEYIIDAIRMSYQKDIDGAYNLTKEVIGFKSSNIGSDVSETMLAIYTKNYNLVTKDVLDNLMIVLGNNLSKIMSIYLNNTINNIDKFVLSLCLIAELNKSSAAVQKERRMKTESSTGVSVKVEGLAGSGKFS